MKKHIKYIFHRIFARKEFASVWTLLYKLSLKGLNYGYCDNPSKSGERSVIEILRGKQPLNGVYYTLVNVGANEGQYLSLFSKYIPNYKAILFEPSAKCYKNLLEINENIEIFNTAIGNETGVCRLYYDLEGSVQASLMPTGNQNSEQVAITTLDEILEADIKIDLLVIDTEGFEKNVLLGAKDLIKNNRIQMIQFEHGSEQSILNKTYIRDFFELLNQYHLFHIKQNGIKQITYSTDKEIFYNTNYLAILK